MRRSALFRIVLSSFVGLVATGVVDAEAVEPVSVVLSEPPHSGDAGKCAVIVTITNNGEQAITLFRYSVPLNWGTQGLPNNQFTVTNLEGAEQKYVGNYDYVVPSDADYTELGPHQSVTGRVQLRYSYSFDTQV